MSHIAADGGNALLRLERAIANANHEIPLIRHGGRVNEIAPGYYRIAGLSRHLMLGERVSLESARGPVIGEVVRIDAEAATVKPYDSNPVARLGDIAWRMGPLTIAPSQSWKGRIINALGQPADGKGPLAFGERSYMTEGSPPAATRRQRVNKALSTGIRVIDLFTPICAGQRVGIFAGSGIGKSTLLAMLAHSQGFDTIVVALVGERGREVRDFVEETMKDNLERTVVVVATGDESAMLRRQAPATAMTIAEHFRDRGESVLLIVDSITRYAHACREVALAAGEPPVARGYAPSVFGDIPKLLERAGPGEDGLGSITGVFAVLVDGDDHNDPVADSVRGTLDGHVVLDRAIAEQGRYPPVNVLGSISRLAHHVWTSEQRNLVVKLRALVARYEDTRDLRLLGSYQPGSDPELDQAVHLVPRIYEFIRQSPGAPMTAAVFKELAEALSGPPPEKPA
ncbi:MAG: flagellar protein export ATPase FliI [Parvibaculaceae bacterium]